MARHDGEVNARVRAAGRRGQGTDGEPVLDGMLRMRGEKRTKNAKTGGCKSRPGARRGLYWLGFGLGVGTIDG